MPRVSLKKILDKQTLQPLLQNLTFGMNTAIAIEDIHGQILLHLNGQPSSHRHPILISDSEDVIGWVVGEKQASVVADLLSLVAKQEAEKKRTGKRIAGALSGN